MTDWIRKLRGRLQRAGAEADLQEEMRTHVTMKIAAGADPTEAQRQFGNPTLVLEDARDAWGWPRPEACLRDFRYGLRMMSRRPAFTATVILTLALGVAASTTMYALIDTVLIRPLPYPDAERLVILNEVRLTAERARARVSPGRLQDWSRLTRAFETISGSYSETFTDTTDSVPERVPGAFVAPAFFAVLSRPAQLGRVFSTREEQFGGPAAIVISDGFWRRRFAADPAVLGRTLTLTGQNYTIVGVMPAAFEYPAPSTDVWVPKQARPGLLQIREARFYDAIARVRHGLTAADAQADLAAVQADLARLYPKSDAGWTVAIDPLKDRVIGKVGPALWLMLASAGLLLLIACADIACLLLARFHSRSAEIATRCALGASRGAIVRQLLAEGLAYATFGGLLGFAASFAGVLLLRRQLADLPRITELAVDARMLTFVTAISILAAILCSLAPVLATFRRDIAGAIIRSGRGTIASQRLPRMLVTAQFAIATVLLVGASLFLQSVLHLQETSLGFHPDNVLTLRIGATFSEPPPSVVERHRRTLDALTSLPGIESVAMSNGLPGAAPLAPTEFHLAGETADANAEKLFAGQRMVTSAYFESLRIPLLAGSTCRMNSDPQRAFEGLVNQKFVDRFLPGRNPIGRFLLQGPLDNARNIEVVGVVANIREEGYAREPEPLIYSCGFLRFWPDADFLIRTRADFAATANSVREAVRIIDPARPVYSVRPLTTVLSGTLSQNRFRAALVSIFSILALALAVIGLYGVMAFMVTQRTREIGLRLALGATPGEIVTVVLRSAGMLVGTGAVLGIVASAAAGTLLTSLLYGVHPADPVTYATAAVTLFIVALLACLVPARRAIRIDPTEALREQ